MLSIFILFYFLQGGQVHVVAPSLQGPPIQASFGNDAKGLIAMQDWLRQKTPAAHQKRVGACLAQRGNQDSNAKQFITKTSQLLIVWPEGAINKMEEAGAWPKGYERAYDACKELFTTQMVKAQETQKKQNQELTKNVTLEKHWAGTYTLGGSDGKEPILLDATQRVSAALGRHFGVSWSFHGAPEGTLVVHQVTWVSPDGQSTVVEQSCPIGDKCGTGWTFEKKEEMQLGAWKSQVRVGERLLLEQYYFVH